MEYNSSGALSVSTFAADSALPISDALVRIYGADEENRDIEYSTLTDIDGRSRPIILSAPSKAYSLAPGAKEKPYYSYDIYIDKNGYTSKVLRGVAVFENITTALIVNMIPKSNSALTDLNTESNSLENPNLE